LTSQPDAELCRRLGDRVQAEVARALGTTGEVALVNFPHVRNIGDSAIWLGTLAVLEQLSVTIAYECEPPAYRRSRLAARIGERGTILIQGGGNLGDVHRPQQSVREQVLRDFPRARIVQLPQSIRFRRRRSLERFGALAGSHDDFTLIARDRASFAFAEEVLGVRTAFAPDMAFALGPLERVGAPLHDVVWLSPAAADPMHNREIADGSIERFDWAGRDSERRLPPRVRALGRARRALAGPPPRRGPGAGARMALASRLHRPLARGRLAAGIALLSAGRAVLTDRLHGHILALLLGIPQVAIEDAEGKVQGALDEWTGEARLAHRAESPEAGIETALALAREARGRPSSEDGGR
jgi:exopolysaccharide biosynthesis predicted pyruvyltransferase EpsI